MYASIFLYRNLYAASETHKGKKGRDSFYLFNVPQMRVIYFFISYNYNHRYNSSQ